MRHPGVVLLLAFALVPAGATRASEPCQAFATLPLLASHTDLSSGRDLALTVCVRNVSVAQGRPVAASLTGGVRVNLACSESFCLTPFPGTLTFLDCDVEHAGVADCGPDPLDPNRAVVSLTGAGIELQPEETTCFATLHARPTAPVSFSDGRLFVVAATGGADVRAGNGACTNAVATSLALRFPDEDGDDVGDLRDRCPGTWPLEAWIEGVDEHGCSQRQFCALRDRQPMRCTRADWLRDEAHVKNPLDCAYEKSTRLCLPF